jgi:hypothetical protein
MSTLRHVGNWKRDAVVDGSSASKKRYRGKAKITWPEMDEVRDLVSRIPSDDDALRLPVTMMTRFSRQLLDLHDKYVVDGGNDAVSCVPTIYDEEKALLSASNAILADGAGANGNGNAAALEELLTKATVYESASNELEVTISDIVFNLNAAIGELQAHLIPRMSKHKSAGFGVTYEFVQDFLEDTVLTESTCAKVLDNMFSHDATTEILVDINTEMCRIRAVETDQGRPSTRFERTVENLTLASLSNNYVNAVCKRRRAAHYFLQHIALSAASLVQKFYDNYADFNTREESMASNGAM